MARSPWVAGGAAVGGLAGALTAAIAGLCCAGPITIALLGAGGAVAAAGLAPYRLPLLVASAAARSHSVHVTGRPARVSASRKALRVASTFGHVASKINSM